MARLLSESLDLTVVDEFTSVVDRTVAQIGSSALAKTIRKRQQKFIAVTCHEDVCDWLQPDWVYRPAEQRFAWRDLRRRPPIEITINRVHSSTWNLFKHHHYLNNKLNSSATCFVAYWKEVPVAFVAWLQFVGRLKDKRLAKRVHRLVCLPDFQGVGIGGALTSFTSSIWLGLGYRVFMASGHPSIIQSYNRSRDWKLIRPPSFTNKYKGDILAKARADLRLSASFEYVGSAMDLSLAKQALNTWVNIKE